MKFAFCLSVLLVTIATVGCGKTEYQRNSVSNSIEPLKGGKIERIEYDSEEFENASREVQEDAVIYNILRDSGFSHSDSMDAVINTQ